MLFMIIERFKNADPRPVGERFAERGRMLPDGLAYVTSWMDGPNARCFQVMETADPELLKLWISRWDDLVDFEVIPIETSADYWAKIRSE